MQLRQVQARLRQLSVAVQAGPFPLTKTLWQEHLSSESWCDIHALFCFFPCLKLHLQRVTNFPSPFHQASGRTLTTAKAWFNPNSNGMHRFLSC